MAIRLLATYEFIDKDGRAAGMVRLPVVDYAQPDADGRERPRVLLLSGDDPYLVDFHPDSTIETQYGTLEALLIDAVADPIPLSPAGSPRSLSNRSTSRRNGWACIPCSPGSPSRTRASTMALSDVLLIPQRNDRLGSHSGPVSTRDLPGVVRLPA